MDKPRRRSTTEQDLWIPLSRSLAFLLTSPRLFLLSALLVVATAALTWLGYHEAIRLVDGWMGGFFQHPPDNGHWWSWPIHAGWQVLKFLFLAVTRVAAFYLAFLAAYCLTCPGYVFLASATEKKFLGGRLDDDAGFSLRGIWIDLLEGIKIGLLGILVTILALAVNFLPVVGQILVFLIYTFYSALMFLDYPASNRRWSLGRKIDWIRSHQDRSFRLGLLPALITMIPLVNTLFIALLFPLFTVHTTLNFLVVERDHS